MDQQKDKDLSELTRPIPSQAEGEVDPGEHDQFDRPVPSQAEGDRETIDEDLKRKRKA